MSKMGKASYNINGTVQKDFVDIKLDNNKITSETLPPEQLSSTLDNNDVKPEAGKFRTILPQILASTAKNLLLLDLGLSIAFPTIVIPALRGTIKQTNIIEPLHFSSVQASWFGSIAFICQPIGSVLSGWISEPLGRKRAMIVVNIPHIIAWILLHYANSLEAMYLGAILLGLGVGFMEAPIITYVGEICQPSIRGILISCAGVAVTLGLSIVYLLGSVTDWRTAALISLSVPLITVVAISFVPETPMWLLSKGRVDDARKSLQWLRGWVSPKAVEKEFQEMCRYSENSNKCIHCQKADIKCEHPPPKLLEKLNELKRKRTLKAFFLVLTIFAIGQFNGILAMRPYMVQIFKAYGVPIDPSWATVAIGVVAFIANISNMTCVKLIGKRKICLTGLIGSLLCCASLASYGTALFPPGYNSFDIGNDIPVRKSYFPLVVFLLLAYCTNGGVSSTPWMLLSEVFPFKSRGLATGITAALNYVLGFITTKTYLNLDKDLALDGAMWFYTGINVLGILFVYFFMPETENCTLEDIENHFSENSRKLTDIKIKKISTISDKVAMNGISVNGNVENKSGTEISHVVELGCDNKAYTEN